MYPRVLHITPEYPPDQFGGVGTHVSLLSTGLAKRGCSTDVFAYHPSKAYTVESEKLTVTYVSAGKLPDNFEDRFAWVERISDLLINSIVAFYEREGLRPDMVHYHDWFGGIAARKVSDLFGVPLVATQHTAYGHLGRLCGFSIPEPLVQAEDDLFRNCDLTIVVSAFLKGLAIQWHSAHPDNVIVVPNGVDVQSFQGELSEPTGRETMLQRLGITDAMIVFCPGRLSPEKDQVAILRAADTVLAEFGPVSYVFTGTPAGEYGELLNGVIRTGHGMEGHVIFIEERCREQLMDVYKAADLVVISSICESFPYVALEAMASGLPVVAALTGGLPEIVQHGDTGLLVPLAENEHGLMRVEVEALAECQLMLLRDSKLRSRLGSAGAERVRSCFSQEQMVSRTLQIYSSFQ